jgi:hypothetical protein
MHGQQNIKKPNEYTRNCKHHKYFILFYCKHENVFNILITENNCDFNEYNLRTCISLDETSELYKLYYQQLQLEVRELLSKALVVNCLMVIGKC